MTEELLQFIWEHRLHGVNHLITTNGETVELIHPGYLNRGVGPDFFNAKIKVGDVLLVGTVEVHVHSSDWHRHNHGGDAEYSNVILHVVATHDRELYIGERLLPTVELEVSSHILKNYIALQQKHHAIACRDYFNKDASFFSMWLTRVGTERLERKTERIEAYLAETENDWEQVLFRLLCKYFGGQVNEALFERVARSLPLKTIQKHKDSLLQIESLLFGQAGMLTKSIDGDPYYQALRNEYHFLSKKYGLVPIEEPLWRFGRLRPVNFPTVRLAQLAALMQTSQPLFSQIIELKKVEDIMSLFEAVPSTYWETHYRFEKEAFKKIKKLGEMQISVLLINVVAPILFVYGRKVGNDALMEKAITLLEQLKPENNTYVREWKGLGVRPKNAFESQSLLELYEQYCMPKRCVHCQVGHKYLQAHRDEL